MSNALGYLVSSERAGIEGPKGYFMVTGARNGQSRAFEQFTQWCGNPDADMFHPIDPVGSVDTRRIDEYVMRHLARHIGILVGICDQSLDCNSRVHAVEQRTIDVAKQSKKKVILLFQDPDHVVDSPMTERGRSALVDVVVLNDVMFSANEPRWERAAKELFPSAAIIITHMLAFGGGSAVRRQMNNACGEVMG